MKNKIKSFTDLDIYQLSVKLVVKIYKLTKRFPSSERFGIIDQLRRAANSIGANIAEGFGRYHTKDFVKFLYNARGSLFEVNHFLIVSEHLGYLRKAKLENFNQDIHILGIKLNNLISALNKNNR
jgi:four helix bundle protein